MNAFCGESTGVIASDIDIEFLYVVLMLNSPGAFDSIWYDADAPGLNLLTSLLFLLSSELTDVIEKNVAVG